LAGLAAEQRQGRAGHQIRRNSPHVVAPPPLGRFYLSHKLDRVWIAVELLDTGTSEGM
jgi:hypothetical protein